VSSPSRIPQILIGLFSGLMVVACGAGPGVSRYFPATKPVVALLPDAGFAMLLLVGVIFCRSRESKKTAAWTAGWIFLICVMVIAVPSISVLGQQGLFGLRALAWGLVIAMTVQSKLVDATIALRLRTLVLLVLVSNMLVALVQAVVGLSAVDLQALAEAGASYQVESQTRLLGLQATGQELSMLAGSGFVWSCAIVVSRGFRRTGTLVWMLGVLSAVVTLVVLQRSALVGAFAAMAVVIFSVGSATFKGRRGASARRFGVVVGAALVSISVLAVVTPDRVDLALSRFATLFGLSTDYSFSVRQDTTLPVALRLIGEQPFGYGLGASGPVAARYAPAGPLADFPLGGIAADNGYLYMALQVGIPGVILFGILLLSWAICGGFVELAPRERLAPRAVVTFLGAIMISGSFWGLTGSMAVVVILASINDSRYVSEHTVQPVVQPSARADV
jgi:hypothetical protein